MLSRLPLLMICLLASCANSVNKSQLIGRYHMINGPSLTLEIGGNGVGTLSDFKRTSKIEWSLGNGQIFLEIPPYFLSQLVPLNLAPGVGKQYVNQKNPGEFGLTPVCSIVRSCRSLLDAEGRIYFQKI